MKFGSLKAPVLALAMGLLAGCGGGPSGVYSVAPAARPEMASNAPGGGNYSVYRAVGFENDQNPVVQRVWTASLSRGEQLGFRWEVPPGDRWAPQSGLHLIAYAGHQTYDLGSFGRRDMKYIWAGSEGDVVGYFQMHAMNNAVRTVTLQ